VSGAMSEEEQRFVAALRALVAVARSRGVSAGAISGALIACASEETAVHLGLSRAQSHPLAEAAVEGMRQAAWQTRAS